MLKLNVSNNVLLRPATANDVAIARVTTNPAYPTALRDGACFLSDDIREPVAEDFRYVLARRVSRPESLPKHNVIMISPDLEYLADGDVIRIRPDGRIKTIYRRAAKTNSLLVTERCNSFCVMCSQPPRDINDDYLIDEYLKAIPLMDRGTKEIGITGGEPSLLGERLLVLIRALKSFLPETSVHVLSNGRRFNDIDLCRALANVHHPNIMLGIPLYSDVSSLHDFVVQADGSYDETIRGIVNLKRCGVRVEIRVVLHRYTVARLPQLARFIVRNLQFVDHVALMGLEPMGFAKSNIDDLWIDPVEYQPELVVATRTLSRARIWTSVYNHQLCVLDPAVRSYAVKSISDWKNEYMPECAGCDSMRDCGGFFSSSVIRRSAHIHPMSAASTSGVHCVSGDKALEGNLTAAT